eukprot:328843_1
MSELHIEFEYRWKFIMQQFVKDVLFHDHACSKILSSAAGYIVGTFIRDKGWVFYKMNDTFEFKRQLRFYVFSKVGMNTQLQSKKKRRKNIILYPVTAYSPLLVVVKS